MITILIMIGNFRVVNFKTRNYIFRQFLLHRRLPQVIYVRLLSFKQFKLIVRITKGMHVKMTRIESGVTVPKGLLTLYMNGKIVTATWRSNLE
jgi:hypothetical protein